MNGLYWIFHYFSIGVFKVFYRHKVYGRNKYPPGAAIIAPNHASFYDPPVVALSCPEEVHFLARESLFKRFPLSWIIPKFNAHPVNNENPSDRASLKLICNLLGTGKKVVIFPEGTRTRSGEITSLKSGISMLALRCQCAVIPVYIHGTYEVWPPDRKFPKLWGKTACVYGTPISWEQFQGLDKKSAQEAMTAKTKESIENLRLWYEAGACGATP